MKKLKDMVKDAAVEVEKELKISGLVGTVYEEAAYLIAKKTLLQLNDTEVFFVADKTPAVNKP